MAQTRSQSDPEDHAADESDSAYLRDRAAEARARMHRAWCQFGSALRRTATNPRELIRYHPIGTTVVVGVVAGLAARRLVKPVATNPSRGLLGDAFRAIRSTLVQSIVSQTIVAALSDPQPADDPDDPTAEPPA